MPHMKRREVCLSVCQRSSRIPPAPVHPDAAAVHRHIAAVRAVAAVPAAAAAAAAACEELYECQGVQSEFES